MSYMRELRSTLETKLAPLPEAERTAAIRFITDEVLQSYKNGLRDAREKRPAGDTAGRSASARGQKRYKHNHSKI